VSAVKYEVGFHIPEHGILNSHRRENFRSYIELNVGLCSGDVTCLLLITNWVLYPERSILQSHRGENLKSYISLAGWAL
jgi:hypothetical protein